MSEPEITQDEKDVEGHVSRVRETPNASSADTAAQQPDDDDVAGHGVNTKR